MKNEVNKMQESAYMFWGAYSIQVWRNAENLLPVANGVYGTSHHSTIKLIRA